MGQAMEMTATSRRQAVRATASLLAVSLITASFGCSGDSNARSNGLFSTALAQRREIIVQVSATGTVGAIRVIEIKSKASGAILRLPVETGQVVKAGQLLVQVDTTDVAAQVRQAQADLDVARARLTIATRKKERSDDLLRQGMISQDEYDQAVLEYQTARATVLKSQTSLDQTWERLSDTLVRAPSNGTILSKSVEEGQIIASAVSQVSGGTTLMKMADLTRVQVRMLVDETDFGKVRPGQSATVEVDAYPNRQFFGSILKIEPEAVTQQSITFFPVLIEIDNEEGLLKPGMSVDVNIHVLRLDNVLAVPNEAVKTLRSAILTAPLLGLNADSVAAKLAEAQPGRRQMGEREQASAGGEQRRSFNSGGGTGERRRPEGSAQTGARPGGDARARLAMLMGGASQGGTGEAVVFLKTPSGTQPTMIRIGAQSWDYTQVLYGLEEGATLIVPPSAALAQQSQQMRERALQMSGGGVMGRQSTGSAPGGGGTGR